MNKEHLRILKSGVESWNEWRQNTMRVVDLSYANLTDDDRFEADLTGANFSEAELFYADLTDAILSGAILRGARNLHKVNFSEVKLDVPLGIVEDQEEEKKDN